MFILLDNSISWYLAERRREKRRQGERHTGREERKEREIQIIIFKRENLKV